MSVDTLEQHEALIRAMLDPRAWKAEGGQRRRIDTHISTVVLAGDRAYKIKKPLDLGFLNFLDLEDREKACREELRLNRRLAPQIYLDVSRITGALNSPEIEGPGQLLDWAVQMQRFDPDAILSAMLDRVTPELLDALARQIGKFHAAAAQASDDLSFGSTEAVFSPMMQNFEQLREFVPSRLGQLTPIEQWTVLQQQRLADRIDGRRRDGKVRECHGDLHLGNVALIDNEAVVFDAIEFNPGFRWIDVINDIAFMTMDLKQRLGRESASRFLNGYLAISADYGGVALLRLYEVYRALVRAKIAAIRLCQLDAADPERETIWQELDGYLELAAQLAVPQRGAIIMMRGVSGSGKSFVAQQIADRLPAIFVRSDVERKRLLGLAATADASMAGGYDDNITEATYAQLARLTEQVSVAGYVVVVDATFLKRSQREPFHRLCNHLGLPLVIVDCDAPVDVLKHRVTERTMQEDNVSDATHAVLVHQLATREPLESDEGDIVLEVGPAKPLDWEALVAGVA